MSSFFDKFTIDDLLDEMEAVYLNDTRPWIIGYSSGKDSSCVLHLTFKMLKRLPENKRHKMVYVISSDTLIENPIILDFLKYNIELINRSANEFNLPVEAIVVQPEYIDSFWANVIGRGYPTPKSIQYRWCTERLKIRPSNKFIQEKLKKEDVVVLLGVRKSESIARKQRIQNKEIDGYLLIPHDTLRSKNGMAYVYSPIVDFSIDDVWDVLFHNNDNLKEFNGNTSPATEWGSSSLELFNLYIKGSGDSGECPFIADESSAKSSCANSRFGCWICTVVKKDKSLTGFIESGYEELSPLLDFRTWILDERDKPENRKFHKRNGAIVKKNGKLTPGPFTFEARKMILRKLLETQLEIQKVYKKDYKLITTEELREIDKIWCDEEDLTSSELIKIYKEVMGEDLPWSNYKLPLFEKHTIDIISNKCDEFGINMDMFTKLIIDTNKYKYFSNHKKLKESVDKTLNQQWLHQDIIAKIEEEDILENGDNLEDEN